MTHAVGLRTYQLYVTRKREAEFVDPNDPDLTTKLPAAINEFVSKFATANTVDIQEKTWGIYEVESHGEGCSIGKVAYGRYGYAATLKDIGTGKTTYRRGRNESEELELYYRFWHPDGEKFIFAAFESFSGKSCISLVLENLKGFFEHRNSEYTLRVRRIMPSGSSEAIYAGKPVKNLTLVSRKPPNDIANKLFAGKAQSTKRMSITVYSGRNGAFGSFSDLVSNIPQDSSGVILYDGIEFDQATAHVKIGNEIKPVGVFGASSDVGVIDITDAVTKDDEGLPTFESVDVEARKVLDAAYAILHGNKE